MHTIALGRIHQTVGMTSRYDRLLSLLAAVGTDRRDAAIDGAGSRDRHRLAPGMAFRLDRLHSLLVTVCASDGFGAIRSTGGLDDHRCPP